MFGPSGVNCPHSTFSNSGESISHITSGKHPPKALFWERMPELVWEGHQGAEVAYVTRGTIASLSATNNKKETGILGYQVLRIRGASRFGHFAF